jgi:VanZ family protein
MYHKNEKKKHRTRKKKSHFTMYFTTGLVFIIKRYPDVDNIKSALQIIFLDALGFLENEISLLAAKVL